MNEKQEKVILPTLAPVDYKITKKKTINITNKKMIAFKHIIVKM